MLNIGPFPNSIPQPFQSPFGWTPPVNNAPIQPRELSLPRYVNYGADYSGCGFWRILWPEMVINSTGRGCSSTLTAMVLDPRWYQGIRAIKVQRQASNDQKRFMEFLKHAQQQHGFKLIYEVDDVVFREDIPDYNKFKFAFDNDEIRNNCIDIINMCDEVTVTCDFMRKLYQQKTGKQEITVIPNFVPYFWMGHLFNRNKVYANYENNKKKPRVLYAGSGAHYDVDNKNNGVDDFSHVLETVIRTMDKYQWVFLGAYPPPLHRYIVNKKIEFHNWKSLLEYPGFFESLNVQATIAPLQNNNFNNAKSDIKFIESCILGLPCLVQNMETYKEAPEFLKFTTGEELEEKLDAVLRNKPMYYKNVDIYREFASDRFLEHDHNISAHIEALNTPYGSPERKFLRRWNP
jgi:glycosyltransferase involved in cell wall biosynthesis